MYYCVHNAEIHVSMVACRNVAREDKLRVSKMCGGEDKSRGQELSPSLNGALDNVLNTSHIFVYLVTDSYGN